MLFEEVIAQIEAEIGHNLSIDEIRFGARFYRAGRNMFAESAAEQAEEVFPVLTIDLDKQDGA